MIEISVNKLLKTKHDEIEISADVDINSQTLVTIVGESGSGKSSLLRMLAGLMEPSSGNITVNGETWYDSQRAINLTTQQRKIGFVFQDYSLFENMTARENIAFALRKGFGLKNRSCKEIAGRVDEMIDVLEMREYQYHKPSALSGGQQQRIALGRALISKPTVLLLDEPLSALDPHMRIKLQDEIMRFHEHFQVTTFLVTHSISEVFKIADKVVLIDSGKVVKTGSPSYVLIDEEKYSEDIHVGEIINIFDHKLGSIMTINIDSQYKNIFLESNQKNDFQIGSYVVVNDDKANKNKKSSNQNEVYFIN